MKKLAEMFIDANGKVSFKRVTGAMSFIAGIVFAATGFDVSIVLPFLSYAAAAVGFSLGEKKEIQSGGK